MAIPNRNEVPEELKWDLTRIFKNDEDWEQAYAAAQDKVDQLGELKAHQQNLARICTKV